MFPRERAHGFLGLDPRALVRQRLLERLAGRDELLVDVARRDGVLGVVLRMCARVNPGQIDVVNREGPAGRAARVRAPTCKPPERTTDQNHPPLEMESSFLEGLQFSMKVLISLSVAGPLSYGAAGRVSSRRVGSRTGGGTASSHVLPRVRELV